MEAIHIREIVHAISEDLIFISLPNCDFCKSVVERIECVGRDRASNVFSLRADYSAGSFVEVYCTIGVDLCVSHPVVNRARLVGLAFVEGSLWHLCDELEADVDALDVILFQDGGRNSRCVDDLRRRKGGAIEVNEIEICIFTDMDDLTYFSLVSGQLLFEFLRFLLFCGALHSTSER